MLFAQSAVIQGTVYDSKTKETLPGVTVMVNDSTGTTTDLDGKYSLQVAPGNYNVQFSFIGFKPTSKEIRAKDGETVNLDIRLLEGAEELNVVTVSGTKTERRLVEETVSIEVLKKDLINNTNSVTLSEAIDKVAGVTMFDNQITIRGGSGYQFGAGSRVLLLINDLPLLSVDRGEIRWNFVPLEIVDQVEVTKSASSALYGASALNGVVNVRTGYAKDKPETEALVYYNGYAKPRNKDYAWWTDAPNNPMRYGGQFSTKQRFGDHDLSVGMSYNKTTGFIRLLDSGFSRLTLQYRHRPHRAPGLSYGILANLMDSQEGDYFFWNSTATGAYVPFGSTGNRERGTISPQRRRTIMIDPWVTYFDKFGNKHTLRFRYYHVNLYFTAANPIADQFLAEYQYQRKYRIGLTTTAGIQGQRFNLTDEDLGNHNGYNVATYAQVDQKFGRVNLVAGFRYEYFKLDTAFSNGRPVASAGINYQPGKTTYLRASFGQGFRFPSIAERYVNESLEGINIFPNQDLQPEYGLNSEIGIKQGFKIGKFLGYADLSMFWMEYWNMTEFTFDVYLPDPFPEGAVATDYIGFKSINVSRARIAGFEASVYGEGKIGKTILTWQGGYTYTYGVDLNQGEDVQNIGSYLAKLFKSVGSSSDDVLQPMLKYRMRHSIKNDIQIEYKNFIWGIDTRFYGKVEKVDDIFVAYIPGLKEYRAQNDHGAVLLNLRMGYSFNKYGKLSLIVNNALNSEISYRPARMEAPLNFVLQYKIKI
jgi:iron complex outermembrane receptor protein